MRNLFTKWLSALLIAALLLTTTAFMEELPAPIEGVSIEEAADIPEEAEAIPEEISEDEDVPADPVEEIAVEEIAVEAADEAVEELSDALDLDLAETDAALEIDETIELDDAETLVENQPAAMASGGVYINANMFGDKVLYDYVSTFDTCDENGNDLPGGDGILSNEELKQITYLRMYDYDFSDDPDGEMVFYGYTTLAGVSHLTYLEGLDLSYATLTGTVELIDMPSLERVILNGTTLDGLVIRDCPNLNFIGIDENSKVGSLSVSDCPALVDDLSQGHHSLSIYGSSVGTVKISSCENLVEPLFYESSAVNLTVEDCPALKNLSVNQGLETLKIDNCPNIERISVSGTDIATLDVHGLEKLTYLDASPCSKLETVLANGCKTLNNNALYIDYSSSSLKKLDFTDCDALTSLNIYEKYCTIEEIYASGCDNLESFYLQYSSLISLDLSDCPKLGSVYSGHNDKFTSFKVTNCGALTGVNIQYTPLSALDFTGCDALSSVYVPNNKLTALDLSGHEALTSVTFSNNPLTTLNVSDCTALETLSLPNSVRLNTLNASGCTALTTLSCANNDLTTLDVTGCAALTELDCSNNGLTALSVNGCAALEALSCSENRLSELDLSSLKNLKEADCSYNRLETLKVSGCTALTDLDCYSNKLEDLALTDCAALARLTTSGNPIKSLDLNGCPILAALVSYDNFNYHPYDKEVVFAGDDQALQIDPLTKTDPQLPDDGDAVEINALNFPDAKFRQYVIDNFDVQDTDGKLSKYEIALARFVRLVVERDDDSTDEVLYDPIGVSNLKGIEYLTELVELNCTENRIVSMDLSQNTKLEQLYCQFCGLASLDISKLSKLTSLDCSGNSLTALNLSGNPNLLEIWCTDNRLTALDVSNQPELWQLYCENNQLTALNLSNNKDLDELYCQGNKLTTLDISACSNITKRVTARNYVLSDDKTVASYHYVYNDGVNIEYGSALLKCDSSVKIVGGSPVAPYVAPAKVAATPAPTPAPTPEPIPVISALKKSSKTTLTVAPGTFAQLDWGGAAAKKFKSSKKKVATVNGAGLVTIKAAGKTKITFKVGKKTRTVTLTVKDRTIPTKVFLNLAGSVPAKVGEPQTLTVTLPEGTNSGIKWTTSNKKVATVKNGVVTFKKKGKVTITATATRGKKKAKVKFVVSK